MVAAAVGMLDVRVAARALHVASALAEPFVVSRAGILCSVVLLLVVSCKAVFQPDGVLADCGGKSKPGNLQATLLQRALAWAVTAAAHAVVIDTDTTR